MVILFFSILLNFSWANDRSNGSDVFISKDRVQISEQINQLKDKIDQLSGKVFRLEAELSIMHEKLDAYKADEEVKKQASKESKKVSQLFSSPSRKISSEENNIWVPDPHQRVVDLRLDPIWGNYQTGIIMFKAGQYSDAAFYFQLILSKDPDHCLAGHAQFFLSRVYLEEGKSDLAISGFEKLAAVYDQSPFLAESFFLIAQLQRKAGKEDKADMAEFYLRTAFFLSPEAKKLDELIQKKQVM